MKVGLITFHCALNYGAVLQTTALYTMLERLNSDTELINFRFPPVCSIVDQTRRRELKNIHNLLRFLVKGRTEKKKKTCFDTFLLKHISNISKECNTFQDLKLLYDANPYEVCVCGSDQVWNPYIIHFESAYFLRFADQRSKKISYAASIGQDTIGEDGIAFISNNITSIDTISVREDSAVEILRRAGVTSPIHVNLDPVFFLSKEQWHEKSLPVKIPHGIKKYIFVYRLTDNPVMDNVLQEITQKTGLKCVAITDRLGKIPFITKKYMSVGPGEFLFLLENAEYVVTDSFHGIAFSILFEKKLIAVSNLKRNTRILNILSKLDMRECLVNQSSKKDFIPNVDYSRKYNNCKRILQEEYKRNHDYLISEITGCQNTEIVADN